MSLKTEQGKAAHFKENESYKHKCAKEVLCEWLKSQYIRVEQERKFFVNGIIWFVPDIVCYGEKGIECMFEVVHTHPVNIIKQWRMYSYFHIHNWSDIKVLAVDAEWILRKTGKPSSIQATRILP